MKINRSSGILLHITSLPGPYGIGDFGEEAYKFVDFLYETKQSIWQILPLTPTEKCSPYSGISAFAGHSLLISPDLLVKSNLLTADDLVIPSTYQFDKDYVKFKSVTSFKNSLLKKAYEKFKKNQQNLKFLEEFYLKERYWLDDYALFMTIKEKEKNKSWSEWTRNLRMRQKDALEEIRQNDKDLFEYHLFVQYIFSQQWLTLKLYAHQFNIQIIGDMPVYVDYNSADVWANPNIFQLDNTTLLPTVVSGFPPDDCSGEGQNWNMPIYRWNDSSKQDVFNWWIKRLQKTLEIVDIVRIDHFRGLESYWAIPVDQQFVPLKPKEGHWVKAPGVEFFHFIVKSLGRDLPLIVEDLGSLSKEVFDLRDQFNLTGIKILQFGFSFHPDNIYRPHNYRTNSIAYTATHDNPTIIGWWNLSSREEKNTFIDYILPPSINEQLIHQKENGICLRESLINDISKSIHWYLIKLCLSTVSNLAIIQFQDLLALDDQSRMNDPSKGSNPDDDGPQNWSWRFTWNMLKQHFKDKLKYYTIMFNRDLTIKNT